MFTLFKKRDFGEYVSDTFQFFKQTGKHYLKNYFTISGIILMIMVVVNYFLFQVYFDFFLKIDQLNNNMDYLENYISGNFPIIILVAVSLFLFFIFTSMLNYSIPVIYMDLYEKNNGNNFGSKDILKKFKDNFGKILIFFLGTIFLIVPLLMVVFSVLILLCFVIIGIPLLLFAIPTSFCWITLSFYEYLNNDNGFFESYGDGFRNIKNQYFPIVGSAMVVFIIIQTAMTIFTLIPYSIAMASFFTATQDPSNINVDDTFSTMKIMMTIVMVISMLMSFILNNLLMINQGLVHYSRIEFDENKSSQDSIDLIGSE